MKNKPSFVSELTYTAPVLIAGILLAMLVNQKSEHYAVYTFFASCVLTEIVLIVLFLKQGLTLGAKVFAVCLGMIIGMMALVILR